MFYRREDGEYNSFILINLAGALKKTIGIISSTRVLFKVCRKENWAEVLY